MGDFFGEMQKTKGGGNFVPPACLLRVKEELSGKILSIPCWMCMVKCKIRDPKEHFLKFWDQSIQPLQRSCSDNSFEVWLSDFVTHLHFSRLYFLDLCHFGKVKIIYSLILLQQNKDRLPQCLFRLLGHGQEWKIYKII